MKPRLLSLLVCPDCRQDLTLEARNETGGEVVEGALACSHCRTRFPIREGIPRFVDTDAYAGSFGFEWHKFSDVQIDILNETGESEHTFMGETGWTPRILEGKLVLDAGVGAGRFAEVVSRWGGEVIGVDLSRAVDAARRNLEGRDNVHLVQADLFRLPLRTDAFDAVYSIGVLHHTPDTRKAFAALVPFLKPGGELAVFIYAFGHYHRFSDLWRRVTTRMPAGLLSRIAALSIPLYYLYRVPLLGLAFRFLFPMSMHPRPRWRWLDTFDWYSPKYQHKHTWPEVYGWFEQHGFVDMKLLQQTRDFSLLHVNVKGRKG